MISTKRVLVAAFLVFMFSGVALATGSFSLPTGVIKYDKNKSYNGYTVFTPLTGVEDQMYTYMIDMKGNVVHKWKFDDIKFTPFYYGCLLENGNLLRGLRPYSTPEGLPTPSRKALSYQPTGTIFQEVNWDGKIVWQGRHPGHRDVTPSEFQQLANLSDAQMLDPAAVQTAMSAIESKPGVGNDLARKFEYMEHHDMKKIWNSKLGKYTLLFIANKNVDPNDVKTCGFNGTKQNNSYPNSVSVDVIAEIDMETGELVWEWWLWDHIVQNTDPAKPRYAQAVADADYDGDLEETFYRKVDVNFFSNFGMKSPSKDWAHLNSLDYRADKDLIVFNSREFGETYIINHNTTTEEARGKAGDFLWRFGNPHNYASSRQLGANAKCVQPDLFDAKYSQLWGAHHAQWIAPGLPGAGHILLYNNGQGRVGHSTSDVLEINPFDGNGNFIRELDAGYSGTGYPAGVMNQGPAMNRVERLTSKLIVWGFTGDSHSMYSDVVAGAQRLPNGNTLICAGDTGHFIEVTKDGEVVWEYISPIFDGYYSKNTGIDGFGKSVKGTANPTIIFRAYRYDKNYPGLKGKKLRSEGLIGSKPPKYKGFGFGSGISGEGGGTSGGGSSGAGY